MQTRAVSLFQRTLHDLLGDALDLDVHLQGGHAVGGPGDLEVHVAERVLHPEDIGEDRHPVAFLDQTHRDPRARGAHRDARVHERQRPAADRGHRARTVGLGDLGDHPQRVGERLGFRQHGSDATAGQSSVTDLSTLRTTHEAGLADAERREVVVQHERVLAGALQGIHDGRVTQRTQGRSHDRLGFTAREQCRTMGPRQDADLDRDRTHGGEIAAVDAWRTRQDALTHDVVLQLADRRLHVTGIKAWRFTAAKLLGGRPLDLGDAILTQQLVGDRVRLGELTFVSGLQLAHQGRIQFRRAPLPTGLARLRRQCLDGIDRTLHFLVRIQHCAQHLVLGQLGGFRFDHQHGVPGTGNHHVQRRGFELLEGRIGDVVAVDVANTRSADRAGKRNSGNRQRSRCAQHRRDIRIQVLLRRHDGTDNLHLIHEALGKQRPDRPVDQTAGQRFLLGRPTLAPEEAARDLARGIGLLFIVHGEREERLPGPCRTCTYNGAQHRRAVHGDHDGAGRLARVFSGF